MVVTVSIFRSVPKSVMQYLRMSVSDAVLFLYISQDILYKTLPNLLCILIQDLSSLALHNFYLRGYTNVIFFSF